MNSKKFNKKQNFNFIMIKYKNIKINNNKINYLQKLMKNIINNNKIIIIEMIIKRILKIPIRNNKIQYLMNLRKIS